MEYTHEWIYDFINKTNKLIELEHEFAYFWNASIDNPEYINLIKKVILSIVKYLDPDKLWAIITWIIDGMLWTFHWINYDGGSPSKIDQRIKIATEFINNINLKNYFFYSIINFVDDEHTYNYVDLLTIFLYQSLINKEKNIEEFYTKGNDIKDLIYDKCGEFINSNSKYNILFIILDEIFRVKFMLMTQLVKGEDDDDIIYWIKKLTNFYNFLIKKYNINKERVIYTFNYSWNYGNNYGYTTNLQKIEDFVLND